MSDSLSFAEIDSQDVELLPARTVMSAFTMGKGGGEKGGGEGLNNPAGNGLGGSAGSQQLNVIPVLSNVSEATGGGPGLGGN
ncbi:MAG TPA: hypothetical protein VN327_05325 [Pseudonocardiaceae bacterium]|jgi:hypothetical protein|nr:hypothetical protein [Pseudonocardiaceae bacterium]